MNNVNINIYNLYAICRFKLIKYNLLKPIDKYKYIFANKFGIEIGGRSRIFSSQGEFPIYNIVKNIDNCNFNTSTLWEKSLKEGKNFLFYNNKKGYQYILDATDLSKINNKYDFLISSNVLEHIANPIKALKEWKRILHLGGYMLIIVPNKNSNFDHNRRYTDFKHILNDYKNNVNETDLFHLKEIMKFHDFDMDPGLKRGKKDKDYFKKRSLDNYNNRSLHHHIFNLECLSEMFDYLDIDIIAKDNLYYNYIILGKVR